jgi:tetratricopeptide (TPR) repeat protein
MGGDVETLPGDSQIGVRSEADPEPATILSKGALVGRYLVLECLGVGGMGVVHAAYDPELDRKVALKLVKPWAMARNAVDVRARLLREAQAMAKLTHPNVVAVHDVGTVGQQVFVAMDLVEGMSLRAWLRAEPRTWAQVLEVFLPAGRGLGAAHAQGLVHRDFKPDNVMIGRDGRVLVMDFGLVRAMAGDDGPPAASDPTGESEIDGGSERPLEQALTEHGRVLGTPGYMAAEQLAGRGVDARADQFGFCVALYEALYGERPFAGETPFEISASVVSGEVRPEPRGAAVPRWLRAVVVRGLAASPDARHPSMDELLTALSRDPSRRRRLAIAVGGGATLVLATVLGGLGVMRLHRAHVAEQCEREGRAIEDVWNERTRGELRHALTATASPYASSSYERMEEWLDPWAERWALERGQVCRAARVEGTLGPELLERATACFDEQRERLAATLEVLAASDSKMAAGAAKAAVAFSQLESCADERMLVQRPLTPNAIAASPELGEIRRALARAAALADAGDYAGGLPHAHGALDGAVALGWAPLEAEARLMAAGIRGEIGGYTEVVDELRTAYMLASAAGDDALAAKASILLLRTLGYHLARTSEGLAWADVSTALLERLDRTEGLDAAQLANNIGLVHEVLGDYPGSQGWHHRALALRQRSLTADHPETAHSYANLGNLALLLDDRDGALRWHLRALAVRTAGLGPSHPDVGRSHANTGRVYFARGELDEALEHFRAGYEIFARTVGPGHRDAARVLAHIGDTHRARGDLEAALSHYRRALDLQTPLLGPKHYETAQTTFVLGLVLMRQGRHDEALARFREASAAFEGLGADHPSLPQVRDALEELCELGHAPACVAG